MIVLTEVILISIIVIGIITVCIGVFVSSTRPTDNETTSNGIKIALLGLGIVIAGIIGVLAFRDGHKIGYMDGQKDLYRGKIQYVPQYKMKIDTVWLQK